MGVLFDFPEKEKGKGVLECGKERVPVVEYLDEEVKRSRHSIS